MTRRAKWILAVLGGVLALVAAVVIVALVEQERLERVPDHFPRPEPRASGERHRWPPRFGVNANHVLEHPNAAFRAVQLRAIAAGGLKWVRQTIAWSAVEPKRGPLRFADVDRMMRELAQAGLEMVPVLAFTPLWASTADGSNRAPAKEPEDTDRFVSAMVYRYGPGGSFWREHPELRARPVRAWEIWNEQNARYFFKPRSGTTFAHHAVVVARAIRAADPRARIIFGGLAGHVDSSHQVEAADTFLADAIHAQPSLKRLLDAVAYHAYGDAGAVVKMTCAMRAEMDHLGLARTPLVLNEFGSVTRGLGAVGSEQERVKRMGETVAAVVTPGTCPRPADVALVAPYTWWSYQERAEQAEHWFGLAQHDGKPFPSGLTYLRAAAGADRTYPR